MQVATREPAVRDLTVTGLEPLWGMRGLYIFYRPWLFERGARMTEGLTREGLSG